MNEYVFSFLAGVASAFIADFILGAITEKYRREQKSPLVDRVSSHQAKPVKAWAPVERRCDCCGGTFWVDASSTVTACGGEWCDRRHL